MIAIQRTMWIPCSWGAEMLGHPACLASPGLEKRSHLPKCLGRLQDHQPTLHRDREGWTEVHIYTCKERVTALHSNYGGASMPPRSWPESKVWTVPLEHPSPRQAEAAPRPLPRTPTCSGEGEAEQGDGNPWTEKEFLFWPSSLRPHETFSSVRHENLAGRKDVLRAQVLGVQRNSWLRSFETDAKNTLSMSCNYCPWRTEKGEGRRLIKDINSCT